MRLFENAYSRSGPVPISEGSSVSGSGLYPDTRVIIAVEPEDRSYRARGGQLPTRTSISQRLPPCDRLALLVGGELRLAPEFHALRLRVGAAPCRAFLDAAVFELRRNAKDGENDLG
jgi:hypothetical protein